MSGIAEDMTLEEMRQSRSYFVQLAQERNDEFDRLRARVAELEGAVRACFDEDDLIPFHTEEGEQWYTVSRGGQKAQCFGVSTLATQELRRLVPRLAEKEQR